MVIETVSSQSFYDDSQFQTAFVHLIKARVSLKQTALIGHVVLGIRQ